MHLNSSINMHTVMCYLCDSTFVKLYTPFVILALHSVSRMKPMLHSQWLVWNCMQVTKVHVSQRAKGKAKHYHVSAPPEVWSGLRHYTCTHSSVLS